MEKPEGLDAAVLRLVKAGKTRVEIAREIGRSLKSVTGAVARLRHCRKLTGEVPMGDVPRNPLAPESMRQVIKRMHADGKTMLDMARHLRRPINIVKHECRRLVLLKIIPAMPEVAPPDGRGAAMARALSENWKDEKTYWSSKAAIGGARKNVSDDEQALIARFLSTRGPTVCRPAAAGGAVDTEWEWLAGA